MTTQKIYYDEPNLFIFVQSDEQEKATLLLEELQIRLIGHGYKTKVLCNFPKKMRQNSINHCFQVFEEKMEINFWKGYGNPICSKLFIKNVDISPEQLFEVIMNGEVINCDDYEFVSQTEQSS